MPHPVRDFYEFGSLRLETAERRLLRDGEPVPLSPKVFDTLVVLLENAGHLVSKDELMAALWPGTVVEEANLTKNVWLLRKALGDSAGASPFIETVPKVGYRWVAPVRRGHETRPADLPTAELSPVEPQRPAMPPAAAPASIPVPESDRPPPASSIEGGEMPRLRSRRPWAVAVSVAAGAALVASMWIALARRAQAPQPDAARGTRAGAVPVRRSLAVVGFQDLSPRADSAWLSTAIGEMIASELAAGERLRIVAAEDVAREKITAPAGALATTTLERLRRNLSADLVVSGAYATVPGTGGERLRLDVVIQDTRSGERVGTATATGMEGDLFQLVSSLGASLRGKLGLAVATSAEQAIVAASLPRDPEAARLYAQGLERQRLADAPAARPLLEQSIAREPRFAPAHHILSAALSGLGYQARAREEAKKAVDLDAGMSREERLNLEGRLHEVNHETDAAVETFRTLHGFFPDNLEYGLRLAQDLAGSGHPEEASRGLAEIRRLPAPLGTDPRIDYMEAIAGEYTADWNGVIAAADRAVKGAQERGSPQLAAEAWLARAYALDSLGRMDEKKAAVESAASLFSAAGDSNGQARATNSLANIFLTLGDVKTAEQLYRRALSTFRAVGNQDGAAGALSNLNTVEWLRGQYGDSRRGAEALLSIQKDLENSHGQVWAEANLGGILADHGDIDEALRLQRDALAVSQRADYRDYVLYAHYALADTLEIEGKLDEARTHLDAALDLSREMSDPGNIA
ncbi:MAG TPA: winged helix-turn-helix domain-containing protein, partial [Thermoanaerobaculia bacterium]